MDKEIILRYAQQKYNAKPDFPWRKYPTYFVLRVNPAKTTKQNKWYALFMNISKRKLGLNSDENVDVLNLKCEPNLIGSFIDHKIYFPAYHMNKEHWISILLANVDCEQNIFNLLDMSYDLVCNKRG